MIARKGRGVGAIRPSGAQKQPGAALNMAVRQLPLLDSVDRKKENGIHIHIPRDVDNASGPTNFDAAMVSTLFSASSSNGLWAHRAKRCERLSRVEPHFDHRDRDV